MFDFNLLTSILVAIGIILFVRYGMPYLRSKGFNNIYKDVKTALMIFGYAFRDDKVKAITTIVWAIVNEMEKLNITPEEKRTEAVGLAFKKLIEELNIEMDEEAIGLIIDIAVSFLPPTNQNN